MLSGAYDRVGDILLREDINYGESLANHRYNPFGHSNLITCDTSENNNSRIDLEVRRETLLSSA